MPTSTQIRVRHAGVRPLLAAMLAALLVLVALPVPRATAEEPGTAAPPGVEEAEPQETRPTDATEAEDADATEAEDADATEAEDADAGDQPDADAGETDAGETDAGETDAGETDAGETDAGEDAEEPADDVTATEDGDAPEADGASEDEGEEPPLATADAVAPMTTSLPNMALRHANTLFAYVEAGETVDVSFAKVADVGSEVSVTITVRGPGGVIETCTSPAGAAIGAGCSWSDLSAGASGIWQVDFAPNGGSTGRYEWEIDVRSGGASVAGRVFTDRHNVSQTGSPIDFSLWYQSQEGYRYRADYDQYQGIDSVFVADATGNALADTCVSAYESFDMLGPHADPQFYLPAVGECGDPYKIFFEQPAADLPTTAALWDGTTTWLRPDITLPQLSALAFDPDGGSVHSGEFTFEVTGFTGQLAVQVDANDDGDFDDAEDVTIPAGATDGTVVVPFDGRDGHGNPISSLRELGARVLIDRVGEIHLVNSDVEWRAGLQVTALNGSDMGSTLLYWNDTALRVADRNCTTPVFDGRAGIDSTGGVHGWPCGNNANNGVGGSWGDMRNIDDWTFAAIEETTELAIAGGPLLVTCATDASYFNTAYDGAGGTLPGGTRDLQWGVGVGDATGPASVPSWEPAYVPSTIPDAWTASPYGDADWISYDDSATHTERIDTYHRFQFELSASVPLAGFALPMNFYADNSVPEVWVNGVPQSATQPGLPQAPGDPYTHGGFLEGAEASTVLSDGFQHGLNEIVVHVASDPPRVGFMAQMTPDALCNDLGDAPDSYGTTRAADGPRHAVTDLDEGTDTAALMLGSTVGVEADGQPAVGADLDTFDDAVTDPIALTFGSQTTVTVSATNDSAQGATLVGWIDLDGNGVFDDAERVTATVPASSGTNTYDLQFPVPSASGDTYARFRVFPGAVADPSPTGAASAGEVEDYPVTGAVLDAWECTPDGILFQAPTTIYAVDLVTGQFDTVASDYHDTDINAVGYNVLDGYIYGYAVGSDEAAREIVRVGADGTVEGLGNPDGVPAVNRHVGDVDENGHYWLANGTDWWQIDLDPDSPTYFEVLDSGTHEGISGWGFADWAFVPGGGDYLYTVAYQSGTGQLFRFDRVTHQWAPVGGTLGSLGAMGAVYADADGFLYGSVNASGAIHRIDVQAATAEFFAPGPASGGNDGAMCIEARVLIDLGDAPASYGTRLVNDGARHGLRVFDEMSSTTSLMLGATVDPETDAQPSAGADTDTDDGVADPIFSLPGEPTTVDVIVTNDTDEPATLAGWIDLDGTGTFGAGDRAPLLTIPANSGTATYTLEFPAGTTLEDTYARFRLFGGTVTDPQPTGTAAAGEVEDHLVRVGRVHFEKTVDPADVAVLQPGDTFTYTVTASNLGGVDLTGLSFTDGLGDVLDDAAYNNDLTLVDGPGAVSFDPPSTVTWSGDLAIGETATVTYSVTIDDPPGGDAVLFNAIVGEGPGSNCEANPPNDPDCFTEVPQPQLSGVKTSDASGQVDAGDTVTYQFTISNTGPAAANNAVADDDMSQVLDDATFNGDAVATSGNVSFDAVDQRLTWNGPLAAAGDPGDSVTITYSVAVNDADEMGDGQLLNALLLSGCPNPPVFDPDDPAFDPDCVEIIDVAAWTSVKASDAVGVVEPGDTVGYTITLENTGNVALTDPGALPSIADDLSEVLDDAVYNDDADAAGDGTLNYVDPVLSWEGSLLVGEIVTITYSVTVADAVDLGDGQLANAVTGAPNCPDPAVLDPEDPAFDADCANVLDIEAWTSIKTSDASVPALPGETVTYTVTVANTGNVALDNPGLLPAIADDLTEVLDDAVYNDDATADAGTLTYSEPVLNWEGSLLVGQPVTITYSVTINDADDLGDGQPANAVTGAPNCPDPAVLDPEDAGFNPDCAEITDIAAYTVVKSSTVPASVEPGDTVAYEIVVTNTGGAALTGVDAATFADDLSGVLDDAGYNDDASATTGTVSYAAPTMAWTGDLDVGQSATITYSVTVDSPIAGDFTLVNAVTGGDCPDPAITDPADPTVDPTCVTIAELPGIHYRKTVVGGAVDDLQPGDTVAYKVTVTNTGQVDLVDQSFADDLSEVLDDASFADDAVADLGSVSYSEPVLTWTGDLAVGEVATVTYSVIIDDPVTGDGVLRNQVAGDGPNSNCPPPDPADPDCSTVTSQPVVAVTKELVSPSEPVPGDVVTYRILAHNRGAAVAEQELIVDDLSGVLDTAVYNGDAAAAAGTVSYTEPLLSWQVDIEPDATVELLYTVTVNAADDLGDGRLVNTVAGGSNCPPDATDCTTDDAVRAVTYEKVVVDPVDRPARGGDEVTYQVTVANRGGVRLDGLSFTDDLSAVLEHATWLDDTATDVGSLSYTRPILSWEGDLEAGEVATVTYAVRLDDDAPAGAAVRNVVIGSGPGSNCPPGDGDLADACVAVLDVATVTPPPTGRLPFTGSNLLLFVMLGLGLLFAGSRSVRVAGWRGRSST